jgi:hypothetical protein
MACRALKARRALRTPGPPFVADSCAWQTRRGRDGRQYVSQPNNLGQFVWTPVPPSRGARVRRTVREYAPLVATKAAALASSRIHQALLPGHDYANLQTAWQGRRYYDAFY